VKVDVPEGLVDAVAEAVVDRLATRLEFLDVLTDGLLDNLPELLLRLDERLEPDRAFSVGQIATFTGISEDAVRRAIKRGDLRASKVANRVVVRIADFHDWLDTNVILPHTEPRGGDEGDHPTGGRRLRAVDDSEKL
jgi:excisionase family DNA binding protein